MRYHTLVSLGYSINPSPLVKRDLKSFFLIKRKVFLKTESRRVYFKLPQGGDDKCGKIPPSAIFPPKNIANYPYN